MFSHLHLTSPHLPPTRRAGRGRAPALPKAWPAPTWPPPPTSVTSLLQVQGRGSGGSVPSDVAAGGRGGRLGTGMHGQGGRRLRRRRSSVAHDRMGCAGAPRPAGPQVDVDRGRLSGSGRPSVPAAALDGPVMAAGLFAAYAASVLGDCCRGRSNDAEAKERDRDGLPPGVVATTGPIARRTRPAGYAATGREQRAMRREDGRGGHSCGGNFQGDGERDGDEHDREWRASGKRAAGTSAR